jgi:ribonuclease D
MTEAQHPSFEMVTQPSQHAAAVRDMADSTSIAVDTESNSRHHYPEQLCLIQISTNSKAYIIDAIVLKELTPLGAILANASIQKVIHGADYDIRCLDRHYGFQELTPAAGRLGKASSLCRGTGLCGLGRSSSFCFAGQP